MLCESEVNMLIWMYICARELFPINDNRKKLKYQKALKIKILTQTGKMYRTSCPIYPLPV